jgi:hypothetical protein
MYVISLNPLRGRWLSWRRLETLFSLPQTIPKLMFQLPIALTKITIYDKCGQECVIWVKMAVPNPYNNKK